MLDLLEVNANLGGHHFVGVEVVMPIFKLSRIIYSEPIYNSYPRQYDMTPEERRRNIKRRNDGHILIKIHTRTKIDAYQIFILKSKQVSMGEEVLPQISRNTSVNYLFFSTM